MKKIILLMVFLFMLTGCVKIKDGNGEDGLHYHKDELFSGECEGLTYFDGILANGIYDDLMYVDGTLANDEVDGLLYEEGQLVNGENNGIYYSDGEPATGEFDGKTYYEGIEITNPYYLDVMRVNKLYDVGEKNLTDDDLVYVNDIPCYVLRVSDNKAELMSKEIYNVKYDSSCTTSNYIDTPLKRWMDSYYSDYLGSDPYILDTEVVGYNTIYQPIEPNRPFSEYNKKTTIQKVFAIDVIEAEEYVDKFYFWDYPEPTPWGKFSTGDDKEMFWTTAGFLMSGLTGGHSVTFDGYVTSPIANMRVGGARPVFWLSLD